MRPVPGLLRAALALAALAPHVSAQAWRQDAASLGTTARVLLVGAHPEDEDNALIAWLSLGRKVETAYLALTRGESGPNVAGNERQSALGVVRTAEVLAERQRDRAHQYFTRAYDFGFARTDSIVDAGWPRDSLLKDVVAVIRAYRPHVVISLFSESTDRDATHRAAARLAREAVAAASDSVRFPPATFSRLPAWTTSRLLTRLDSAPTSTAGTVAIDVGEFDRDTGRSYAELGAEIRRLQRTQPAPVAPPIGPVWRFLRAEGGGDAADLFGGNDTTWSRFRGTVPENAQPHIDSLLLALTEARTLAPNGEAAALADALARVATRASRLRLELRCSDVSGVPLCPGMLGDLASSVHFVRARAVRALVGAAAIVVDGTVEREAVAARDSVPLSITVFNGGTSPLTIRRLAANSRSSLLVLLRDTSIVIAPDSSARWSANLRVNSANLHWWQASGLVPGTWIHDFRTGMGVSIVPQVITGEDRIPATGVEMTIALGGLDVPIIESPLVYRNPVTVRGDARRPLTGITPLSVLLDRTAEYERAGIPIDRLFRVFLSSARTTPDTVAVSLRLPAGLRADSASRRVIVPPLGSRSVFFRLRGTVKPGADTVAAGVRTAGTGPTPASQPARMSDGNEFTYGVFARDYPHIPTQRFFRSPKLRLEAVDLRVPPSLRVAYIRGSDDVQAPLGQLQINLQALEPALLPVVDLSVFSTVLIGSGAMENDALTPALASLREYMRGGGTVVILPGGDEIAHSGLLPYPIAFDSTAGAIDLDAALRATDATSPLLRSPNPITAKDFQDWTGERARNVPVSFDPRYRAVLSIGDAEQSPVMPGILLAAVGKGRVIYTSLSLDRQLAAVNPGAARLFVNLLSAGVSSGARRE